MHGFLLAVIGTIMQFAVATGFFIGRYACELCKILLSSPYGHFPLSWLDVWTEVSSIVTDRCYVTDFRLSKNLIMFSYGKSVGLLFLGIVKHTFRAYRYHETTLYFFWAPWSFCFIFWLIILFLLISLIPAFFLSTRVVCSAVVCCLFLSVCVLGS